MKFSYRAKQGPDRIIEGLIEAASEKDAIEQIHAQGLIPTHLEPAQTASKESSGNVQSSAPHQAGKRVGRVPMQAVTVMTRELASLLRAGVPILSCLKIISDQSDNTALKFVLDEIFQSVKEGETFSSSLARYPRIFPALYTALVKTGENSGVLPDCLTRIADYRAKQEETMNRLGMSLAYPGIMALVGLGTVIFMLTYVLPRLLNIFNSIDQKLPVPTQVLLRASSLARHWWLWAGILALIIVVRMQMHIPAVRIQMHRMFLKLPFIGSAIMKNELGRFCRTMEVMLRSGIPILRALAVAFPVVGNEVIRLRLKQTYTELEQGASWGLSLKQSGFFPAFMTNLISVGEQSGKLTDVLQEVASSYERDTDDRIRVMTNLLEPILVLGMGLIVGFLVIAMLLPIFEISMVNP